MGYRMIFNEWASSFMDVFNWLWPSWPGIAPSAVKWELLRRVGLWCGCGIGAGLVVAGVYYETRWGIHGDKADGDR